METVKPAWLEIAEAEVGIKERPGPDEHHPRILEYLATCETLPESMRAQDETSWCSAFVNWCVEQAGHTGTNRANARSWQNWGTGLIEPMHGCIVTLWRDRIDSWKGHVGFLVGIDAEHVELLGGNQSNSVCYLRYPRSRVLSYRAL